MYFCILLDKFPSDAVLNRKSVFVIELEHLFRLQG